MQATEVAKLTLKRVTLVKQKRPLVKVVALHWKISFRRVEAFHQMC